MDSIGLIVVLAILIGAWYAIASLIGRRINIKSIKKCNELCLIEKYLVTGTSFFVEFKCNWAKYLGVFVQRLPWDNPLNLVASLISLRKPMAIVKAELDAPIPWSLDMSSKGALGYAEEIDGFFVVNRNTPKSLVNELVDACKKLGITRLILGGRPPIQLFVQSDDCARVLQLSENIIKIIAKHAKK